MTTTRDVRIVSEATLPTGEPIEGTSVMSDELNLPGPPHLLVWAMVLADGAPVQFHALVDGDGDPDTIRRVVLARAREILSPCDSGIIALTHTTPANADIVPFSTTS